MNKQFGFSHRSKLIAVIVSVLVALLMTGVVLALPGLNVFSVDNLATGFQFLQTTQPNDNNFHVYTLTNVASAPSAVGLERDVVFTATQANARLQNASYLVDDFNRILGISSGSNVTPTAHIEWDGTDGNALSLNPTGLGGVDVVSSTNTGFVLEINQDDLAATLIVKAYTDGSNWSERTVLLPGNVDANSHIDYFVSFSSFTPTAGTGANFANLGAITWDLLGVNSLDFQISNYVADTVWDFGDLPDTYSTTLASGGPYHIVTFLRLGNNVDSESTGQPDTAALGDDNDGNAPYLPGDEEGVTDKTGTFPNYTKWFTGTNGGAVNVTMKGCGSLVTCYLSGWVDWNNDGNFNQAGDQIFNNIALTSDGIRTLNFNIPTTFDTFPSLLSARFRLCSASGACNTYGGSAADGEVEDYRWGFGPLAVTLESLQAQPTTSPVVPVALVGVSAAALIGVVFFFRRRKTA